MLDELKKNESWPKSADDSSSDADHERMIALNAGARPLVNMPAHDKMAVVLAEIIQDKIFLDTSGVLVTAPEDGIDESGELDDDA